MPQIKRYPNRKLYDTDAKRYVTLAHITELIQEGQDVQVVDHETGEDLTNLTLTQIILEQEKQSTSDYLPRALLTSLIRTGGDTLNQVRRSLPGPLGRKSEDGPTEDQTLEQTTAEMEEQAHVAMAQGRQMVDQVQSLLRLDDRMADILHLLNVPSQRDVQQLQARIDELSAKLSRILAAGEATGADIEPSDAPDRPENEQ